MLVPAGKDPVGGQHVEGAAFEEGLNSFAEVLAGVEGHVQVEM
jgi:hypothetical protein